MEKKLQFLLQNKRLRSIRDSVIPAELKLLALGPHPDDFDAIGVTLRFLADRGNSLQVGVVRTGSGVDDSYGHSLTWLDKAHIRKREQQDSIRFFGLPDNCLTFLPFTHDTRGKLLDNSQNFEELSAFVRKKDPDIVFLPHGNDTNNGHRCMYSLFKKFAERSSRSLAAFLHRDPKTTEMRIDLYMPFDQTEADWKSKLLRFHDTQHQRNLLERGIGFDSRILENNRASARELSLGAQFAEVFELELYNVSAQ